VHLWGGLTALLTKFPHSPAKKSDCKKSLLQPGTGLINGLPYFLKSRFAYSSPAPVGSVQQQGGCIFQCGKGNVIYRYQVGKIDGLGFLKRFGLPVLLYLVFVWRRQPN